MRDLLIVCATRERPAGARRLAQAVTATCTAATDLIFAVDDDDRSYDGTDLRPGTVVRGPRQDVAGWTNTVAVPRARDYHAIASLGDDHLPHEREGPGWDELLLGALHGRPGVAYGNDLFQRERWPTAAVIAAPVIAALGYVSPPPEQGGPEHIGIDCFWKRLGEDLGCLEYLDDVIIEHVHPVARKAEWDASYERSNSVAQYSRDETALKLFLDGAWPDELKRLRKELGL